MAQSKKKNIHTISMLVANKPGVLVRVALVFARRGFNIDALSVSPAFNPNYSRMTITAEGNPDALEQIIKQAYKLIDVLHVEEHSDADAVHREMALMKLKVNKTQRQVIRKLAKGFKVHLAHEDEDIIIISQTGTTEELDDLESKLSKYGIIEMVRSGKLVVAKGKEST